MMRAAFIVALAGLGLAFAAATPADADSAQRCRMANSLIAPGKTMCVDGFTSVCQANGAWGIDRHAPCFATSTSHQACPISANEIAAPGTRHCVQGRLRQCSTRGEWIDLAGSC